MRESLFARLGDLSGTRVLDLYAGTGALGAEAASRGAERVVFVERVHRCVAVLRANLAQLGLGELSEVVPRDAVRAVKDLGRRGERFDLVLLDPPYAGEELPRALEVLVAEGVLEDGATLVVEHDRRHPVPIIAGLTVVDERRYGDTAITWLTTRVPRDEMGGTSSA